MTIGVNASSSPSTPLDSAGRPVRRNNRLPWPIIAVALVSLADLYVKSHFFMGVLFLALLLAASGFTNWRLPGGAIVSWLIRIAAFVLIISNIHLPPGKQVEAWYVDPDVMTLAGYLLAAEMTLRVWQPRNPARLAREVFLLAACVMATAAVTYEIVPIHVFAPIYAVAAIVALRSMAKSGESTAAGSAVRKRASAMRAFVWLLAVGIGFASVVTYEKLMYQIDNLALRLLPEFPGHTVGFSTSNHLGVVFNPKPSMDRVLLIDGHLMEPHLRIIAFDSYDDGVWRPFQNDRIFLPFAEASFGAQSTEYQVQITRLENTSDLLPVSLGATHVQCDDSLRIDNLAALFDDSDSGAPYGLSLVKPPDFQGPLCVSPDTAERKRLLAIPPTIDPKVIALAKQVAGTGDDWTRVVRIGQYLRGHYDYSLTFQPHTSEPLNDFILNHRAAHCQYFASALVIMSRAIGVPARYVAGFYAHEAYGSDGMVVRERDAHAWAECWIDGPGWITLDATPAGGLPEEMFSDASLWRNWWEHVLDFPRMLRSWLTSAFAHIGMAVGIGAAIALLIGVVLKALRRQPALASLQYAQPDVQLVELARRFESWLAKRGIAITPNRTWRDCLVQLRESTAPLLFASLYDQARFGGETRAIRDAIQLLETLETQGTDGKTN